MDYQIVQKGERDYPTRLLSMHSFWDNVLEEHFDSPERLYVDGTCLDLLNAPKTISIIGTRSPFHKAFEIGELVGRLATLEGIIVVGGYATGIDTSGHLGAMDANGKTVAVLGSGIHVKQPEKPFLERYILQNGIFISELDDPNAPREYRSLMARNRIIARLSDAVFVIETDIDGGAVHTAKTGKEQGRKIYTIDWDTSARYKDKDRGGNTLMISEDIATAIPLLDGEKGFEKKVIEIFNEIFGI